MSFDKIKSMIATHSHSAVALACAVVAVFLFSLSACANQQGQYAGYPPNSDLQEGIRQVMDSGNAENFHNFITDFVFLEWGVTVLEVQGNTLWAARTASAEPGAAWASQWRTGELLKSTDHGESWNKVYEFSKPVNSVYVDDFGNIFVAVTYDRWASEGTGELFKSSDSGETFRKVLDIESGITLRWNIASRNGTMFASEYGFKGAENRVSRILNRAGNNARRIYRSTDFGETWSIVFEPNPTYNYHNHITLVTDEGIVYQSIGDWGNSKIIRSHDNGYNWETVAHGFQPTSAVVFDTHILWGLDGGPWDGVAGYDRDTGEFSNAFTLPYPFEGSCYDMAIAHGVVYAMFLSYGGDAHSASIFFSEDEGYTWNLLGYIEKLPAFGVGLYHLVVDELFGYIDIETPVHQNDTIDFFVGTLRFELLNAY